MASWTVQEGISVIPSIPWFHLPLLFCHEFTQPTFILHRRSRGSPSTPIFRWQTARPLGVQGFYWGPWLHINRQVPTRKPAASPSFLYIAPAGRFPVCWSATRPHPLNGSSLGHTYASKGILLPRDMAYVEPPRRRLVWPAPWNAMLGIAASRPSSEQGPRPIPGTSLRRLCRVTFTCSRGYAPRPCRVFMGQLGMRPLLGYDLLRRTKLAYMLNSTSALIDKSPSEERSAPGYTGAPAGSPLRTT